MTAQARFAAEVREGVDRLKREIGYNPTYFNRMVAELGPVGATERLVLSDSVSDGFTKLWEHGRLAMSVEALAVLPWYAPLFGAGVVGKARARLVSYGFDVEAHISGRYLSPPSWWDRAEGERLD